MGSPERAIMGLESRAVLALVIKHFVKHVIFSKTCNNFLLTTTMHFSMFLYRMFSLKIKSRNNSNHAR